MRELEHGDLRLRGHRPAPARARWIGLTEHIKTDPRLVDLPVIVYTGKDLTRKEEQLLKTYAESVIHKGDAGLAERFLSDSALFLHLVEDRMPHANAEKLVQTTGEGVARFRGRRFSSSTTTFAISSR